MATSRAAKVRTDHDEIRRRVEARGGCPAHVKRRSRRGDPGILGIDYTGFSGKESLEPIEWEDFFDALETNNLAFVCQDLPDSRFSKLVDRGTVARRSRGERRASKRSQSARTTANGRSERATKARTKKASTRASKATASGTSRGGGRTKAAAAKKKTAKKTRARRRQARG